MKQKQIVLNPDLLGFTGGLFFGMVVMALGFWQQTDGFVIALRAGLTFVVVYAAVFLFARYVMRTMVAEALESRKRAREKQQEDQAAANQEQGEAR